MILLDTHALLWWLSDPDRLPIPTGKRLDALVASGEAARVSAISCWEVPMLVDRGRLEARQYKRPRRGSNAQPRDSKSVTLSIELRGRACEIILEIEMLHAIALGASVVRNEWRSEMTSLPHL